MRILSLLAALLALCSAPAFAKVQAVTEVVDNGVGRAVPLTLIGQPGRSKGVIYFSHGAFSSPAKYDEITRRWAAAGYTVIAPLHADSSDWSGIKPEMKDQTAWRLADMALARRELPRIAAKLKIKIGDAPVFAAGHSFGALIALLDPDPAVRAVIAWSPPGPVPGLTIPATARPLLTITGTADSHPMMAPQWQAHLEAHRRATGLAWAYVGEGADHYFGGIFGRPELPGPKALAPFSDAMALTLRFLRKPQSVAGFAPKAGKLEAR